MRKGEHESTKVAGWSLERRGWKLGGKNNNNKVDLQGICQGFIHRCLLRSAMYLSSTLKKQGP
jgi:hypothetical protein